MSSLIGNKPNQVPVNGYLGKLAFMDSDAPVRGAVATMDVAPTLPSAGTLAPMAYVSFVSGISTISTITVPHGALSSGCQLTLIPTGLWATNTNGNIALATVAVVNKVLILTYDAGTGKWYPSY